MVQTVNKFFNLRNLPSPLPHKYLEAVGSEHTIDNIGIPHTL